MPRGVPQIEITYDVDANGILNVSACEKSSGKSEKITVTNDKGRLSANEINDMVNDAEKFKEDDMKARELIDGRNDLENYMYHVKASLNDPSIKDKLNEDEISSIEINVKKTQDWLSNNNPETKQEYDNIKSELQNVFMPIITRLQTSNSTNENEDSDEDGPVIEEVD